MFDVGTCRLSATELLSFGNCVLKTGVIKWPLKLYVRFYFCLRLFCVQKPHFLLFLSCCTRFLEHYTTAACRVCVNALLRGASLAVSVMHLSGVRLSVCPIYSGR